MGICSSKIKNSDSKKIAHENGLKLIEACAEDDRDKILKLLGEEFIDVNARAGSRGYTPLHVVQSPEVARVLIEAGTEVNIKDFQGSTPLHLTDSIDIAEALIADGAEVNAKNHYRYTPLHTASSGAIVKKLVSLGLNVDDQDSLFNNTPFLCAKSAEAQLALLEAGMDINLKGGAFENSPLHEAQSAKVVRKLLELGANIETKNAHNETPLQHACSIEVAQTLIDCGAKILPPSRSLFGCEGETRNFLLQKVEEMKSENGLTEPCEEEGEQGAVDPDPGLSGSNSEFNGDI